MKLLHPYLYADEGDEVRVALPGRFRATSITNAAMYGYKSFATRYEASPADLLDMVDRLGQDVRVKDRCGRVAWRGMLTEVEAHLPPAPGERQARVLSYSLDDMHNAVAVIFQDSTEYEWELGTQDITGWATTAASVSAYGRKEKILTIHGLTEAQAEYRRDAYLALHDYPLLAQQDTEEDIRQPYAILRGRGYYWTCEWQTYVQTAWGLRATNTQIEDIVTAECPFITAASVVATGVNVQRFRNAYQTAWQEILRLAAIGDSSNNPLLAGVWDDRELVVETLPTSPAYVQRASGRYTDTTGGVVDPWLLQAGKMLRRPVVPGAATLSTELDDPRNVLIWQVSYNEDQGRETITPLQARDAAGLLLGALDPFEL